MKQVRIEQVKVKPRPRPDVLPLDPRDPDVVRAKRIERGNSK